MSAKFESEPFEIVEKKDNSVVIQSREKVQYQRNVTEVKKFTLREEEQSANSDHQLELQEDNELEQRPQRDSPQIAVVNGNNPERKLTLY